MTNKHYDVVIIGGGPGGGTAALYAARANLKTLVIDKSIRAGALGITSLIANWPGIPEISGAELVEKIQEHSKMHGAEYLNTKVTGTYLADEEKQIFTAEGDTITAKAVILSTGAMGKSKTIEGEQELLGRGVSYCATCDAAFFKEKVAGVLGSNEEAAHESIFLTRFVKELYLFCPKSKLEASEEVIHEIENNPKIKVFYNTNVTKVVGENKVTGVETRSRDGVSNVDLDGLFIFTQGNKPIVDYLMDINMTGEGCVLVDKEMKTNIPGVFACGDMLCNGVQQAVVAASQGCIAALSADKYVNNRSGFKKDYK